MFSAALALAGFFVLALGPPAVQSRFHSISFSPVKQCGNFTVLFSGGEPPSSLPLTLTVVPFNATPITIEIPSSSWNQANATGAAITFLPFPAGTEFVASLDDANGVSTGLVSDVILVDQSEDSSCLPSASERPAKRYTVNAPVSQCEPFQVMYNPTVADALPTVRAFFPRSLSFFLNQSAPVETPGNASFTMKSFRGLQVVLMVSDGTGFKEATGLLSVGGNSNSPSSCLPKFVSAMTSATASAEPTSTAATKSTLSKNAIVAIATASSIIVAGIALSMVIWLSREHRKFNSRKLQASKGVGGEKGGDMGRSQGPDEKERPWRMDPEASPVTGFIQGKSLPRIPSKLPTTPLSDSASTSPFVKNPLYTDAKVELVSPVSPQFHEPVTSSLVSGTQELYLSSIPVPLVSPQGPSSAAEVYSNAQVARAPIQDQDPRFRPSSLSSADIEHILEMATIYSGPSTPNNPAQTIIVSNASPTSSASRTPAARISSRVLRVGPAGLFTMVSPTDPVPPSRAITYRDPPQAPLPSSPSLASPGNSGFRRSDLLVPGSRTPGSDGGFNGELLDVMRLSPLPLARVRGYHG